MTQTLKCEFGDKTVQEFLHLFKAGQLNLEPGFQRASVWGLTDRKRLIQSIMGGYPVPSVFLYQTSKRGKLSYEVIDGKQRLESILMFLGAGRFRDDGFEGPVLWVADRDELFLEDVRNMQARSRQEKLAAMGRVSAGIAHEIRNPLAAIAQANALLAEDATDAAQRQLTRMVADNVDRLKRIVDDVMEVAPGAVQDIVAIDATAMVAAICSDWARSVGVKLGEQSVLRVELPPQPLGVAFDAEHLRRVLVNLLDNAHRHASGAPGAVVLRLDSRDDARAFLSVASDGTPITAEVERYLFEPFFSTRSRGTGLGLYICRELCERYGASIDYRARAATAIHGPLMAG